MLTLSDAKHAPGWSEGEHRVPGRADAVMAMAVEVRCYGSGESLEFRFADQSGRLTFEVAQDLDSESSTVELEFSLTANGRAIESKRVAFDEHATLSTDLTGVSAAILTVAGADCRDTTTALVTSATVEAQ
ncbi:hypothetical protein [Microbacterium sp.]|uniref:hypothetical protein n=1 Tax=Microbacterium sp. TaxID=51671 RepID=UPI003A8B2D71